jgi:hypothetical protein
MSQDDTNLLLTMVAIGIGILLVNTILLVLHIKEMKHHRSEHWNAPNVESITGNAMASPDDVGQMKRIPSCTSYGVPNHNNMPFNDDSSLYR